MDPSASSGPGGAVSEFRARARLWALRLVLLSAVTILCLGILELAVRLDPQLFGAQRANEIFSSYDTGPGGIYVRERRTRMRFMWPLLTTQNYWNGFRWQHHTDRRGFRNPDGIQAEVLLLGDSLIYGHGVEEVATVAHLLRSDHQIGAYNMGRQGAALYDEYVFFRTWFPDLRPRTVLLFVFLNDFEDLEVYRTSGEISAMPEIDQIDYAAVRQWAVGLRDRLPSPLARWIGRRPSIRLLRSAASELRKLKWTTPAWAAEPSADPPFVAPLLDIDRRNRQASYYTKILADIGRRCAEAGSDLRIVYLGANPDPEWLAEGQKLAIALVGDAAAASGLPFFDTRSLFAGCVDCFLADDGHFTRAGHQRLARFLAETVLADTAIRTEVPPEVPPE